MRRSVLWLELPLILLALLFVEVAAILRELRTDVVLDWFVSIAPLIWIDASILILYAFLRLYRNPDIAPTIPRVTPRRTVGFLRPNLRVLQSSGSRLRRNWAFA